MTDEINAIRHALYVAPRRDWRFWGAIAAVLLMAASTISVWAIIGDRNHWREAFDRQTTETLCRSQAAAGVNAATAALLTEKARLTITVDRGLAASARGDIAALTGILEELDDAAVTTETAIEALDVAIEAQTAALESCQPQSPPASDPPSTTTKEDPGP